MHIPSSTLISHSKALSAAETLSVELESLAELPQWVAWRLTDGDKPPYSPATGSLASSTNPATWGTRAAAEVRAREIGGSVGIVLGELVDGRGLALIGLDLDSCRDPSTGAVAPWAAAIMARVRTYAEVSPSGTGVKLFGLVELAQLARLRAALGKDGRKWTHSTGPHPAGVEFYTAGRYFTVTGDWEVESPGELRQLDPAVLEELIREENGRKVEAAPGSSAKPGKDQSRSGSAARLAARMKREGATFEAYAEAVASDPVTAEWAGDERQVARAWERMGGLSAAELADASFDVVPDEPGAQTGKPAGLQASKSGVRLSNLRNALALLRGNPALRGLLGFDDMACSAMLMHPVPRFPAGSPPANSTPRPVEDRDVTALLEYLQGAGLTSLTASVTHLAVDARAAECRYHPVRDYLDGLAWDGVPRLDGWLSTYLQAEATPYTAAIGRMFLIAMVARVHDPGCKADYMMVLEGPQGVGKSAACRILGGRWFSDALPELGANGDAVRASQHLAGKWLVELAELSAMRQAEAAQLKAFVTRGVEQYIRKHGRRESVEPRQCVFAGTVNPEGSNGYLKDATGGRRFWPVKVGDALDLVGLARDRDQLFAEAVAGYRAKEQWWPDAAFEREHMAPEQDARRELDPWQDTISAWLANQAGLPVTVGELAREALHVTTDKLTPPIQGRIGRCLREAGWTQHRSKAGRWWEPAHG